MKIALCHSMQYAEKAQEVQDWFATRGHEAYPSSFNHLFLNLSDEEKEKLKLKQKYEDDAICEHMNTIQNCDVVLVLNYDKHGIANYIGGNSFLEIGFAYFHRKPIFLLNPVPDMPFCKTEIIAMKPVVIEGDLEKLIQMAEQKNILIEVGGI